MPVSLFFNSSEGGEKKKKERKSRRRGGVLSLPHPSLVSVLSSRRGRKGVGRKNWLILLIYTSQNERGKGREDRKIARQYFVYKAISSPSQSLSTGRGKGEVESIKRKKWRAILECRLYLSSPPLTQMKKKEEERNSVVKNPLFSKEGGGRARKSGFLFRDITPTLLLIFY